MRQSIVAPSALLLALVLGLWLRGNLPDALSNGIGPEVEEPADELREEAQLEVLPGAEARVPELVEEAPSVAAEVPEQAAEPPLSLGRLSGTVVDDRGEPVPTPWVWWLEEDGARRNAKGSAEGSYALEEIPLGRRLVTASKLHHHDAEVTLLFSAQAADMTHDFVLRREQRIRVRLATSSGEPAVEALVEAGVRLYDWSLAPVATRDDPGETFDGVVGSLNNRFGIGSFWQSGYQGLPALTPDEYGTVSLHEEGPAWLSLVAAHQVVRKQRVDASTESVTFVLDPEDLTRLYARVEGRLVDGLTGASLAGSCGLSQDPFSLRGATATGEDGSFTLEAELPGERYFIASARGRAQLVLPMTLAAGQSVDLGEVALHPPVELSGRVVDGAGEPLEVVLRWGLLDPGTAEVAWVRQQSARSDAEGFFRLSGLRPGIWIVRSPGLPAQPPRPFDARMASACLRVDARGGSVEGLELVLQRTGTLMLVSEEVREPWPRATAFDLAGLPTGSAWIGRWGAETPLLLPPGAYTLVVTRGEVELERHSISIGNEPRRLEFDFSD